MNASAVWRFAATALLSAFLALAGAWFSLNAQAVTKPQVEALIAPDRQTLERTYDELWELRKDVEKLNREVGEVRGLLDHR